MGGDLVGPYQTDHRTHRTDKAGRHDWNNGSYVVRGSSVLFLCFTLRQQ